MWRLRIIGSIVIITDLVFETVRRVPTIVRCIIIVTGGMHIKMAGNN